MLEFNVPPALALESMMVALKVPEGSAPVRPAVAAAGRRAAGDRRSWAPASSASLAALEPGGRSAAPPAPRRRPPPRPPGRPARARRRGLARLLRPASCAWSSLPQATSSAPRLRVPLDYAPPRRRDHRPRAAQGRRPRDPRPGSARWWSTPAARARPAPTTPRTAAQAFREPLLARYDVVGFDPRGTGDSVAGRLPERRAARRLHRLRPRPGHRRRAPRATLGCVDAFGAGCVRALRRPRLPRHHGRGRPRHGRAARGARRVDG